MKIKFHDVSGIYLPDKDFYFPLPICLANILKTLLSYSYHKIMIFIHDLSYLLAPV